MNYGPWNPAPLNPPHSNWDVDDMAGYLTDSEYLDLISSIFDPDELETWKQELLYIKILIGKRMPVETYIDWYRQIESLLEEYGKERGLIND